MKNRAATNNRYLDFVQTRSLISLVYDNHVVNKLKEILVYIYYVSIVNNLLPLPSQKNKKILVNILRKCHSDEARHSRGTKSRRTIKNESLQNVNDLLRERHVTHRHNLLTVFIKSFSTANDCL